jgi:hypothetical protein
MKLYIDCKCGCDVLKIESWDNENTDYEWLWLCIYRSSIGDFWQRLSNAWKYLRRGEYAFNDMTIERKDIDRMIEFLQQVKEVKEAT